MSNLFRTKLKKLGSDKRHRFVGTVDHFSQKNAFRGPPKETMLLVDICLEETGEILCDHLWFTMGKQFDELGLIPGDKIAFDARVAVYEKGYKGRREDVWDHPVYADYKLERPTHVERL